MARRRRTGSPESHTRDVYGSTVGNYGYLIQASPIQPLLGRYNFAAKVIRLVRYDMPTVDLEPPIGFGESWGETAHHAITKLIPKVEAWIRTQPDFSD